MVRTKLVPRRVAKIIQRLSTKFKIKTLLPEQKSIDIKKNGQVIRMVTVEERPKSLQTTGRDLFKKCLHQIGKITISKKNLL